jgi:hypothetical protein
MTAIAIAIEIASASRTDPQSSAKRAKFRVNARPNGARHPEGIGADCRVCVNDERHQGEAGQDLRQPQHAVEHRKRLAQGGVGGDDRTAALNERLRREDDQP